MRLIKRAERGLTLVAGGLHDTIQSVNKAESVVHPNGRTSLC